MNVASETQGSRGELFDCSHCCGETGALLSHFMAGEFDDYTV